MKRARKQNGKGNSSPSRERNVKSSRQNRKAAAEKQIIAKMKDLEAEKHDHPSGEVLRSPVDCLSKRLPLVPLCSGKKFDDSSKIKLQLFPVDKCTRIELEKDGYHPYLELTLSARKKISSVLTHLSQKWGRSRIALGEPMLFPYSKLHNSAVCRWTSNDCETNAGDVHAAIGSPTIFRLRYGWSSAGSIKSERESISGANKENTFIKVEQAAVTNVKSSILSERTISSNELVDPKVNEGKMDTGMGQSSMMWADSLTNISIGGLLSEASLQGKFNQRDPKSKVSQPAAFISDSLDAFLASQMSRSQGPMMLPPKSDGAGFQPSQLNADSFDAFLASQLNQHPCPKLPTFSSILDAEDTCHSFAIQNNPSSLKDTSTFSRGAFSRICSQDGGSKFPNMTETKSGIARDQCEESETELQLCSRVYNDESILALSRIKCDNGGR